ncbi:MAG TPA: STAS domain-containing protein [Caldilineae bacterium]|nr:STAS domain-containing protein [Caldilineae bacterium]
MTATNLEVKHQELKKCDLFILNGRIDGNTAPAFELAIRKAQDKGHYKLVLNMAGVNYMSSAGLRVLISSSKEAKKHRGGDIRLAEVSQRVADVLDLAGLTVLFQIYKTENEAIESFA